MNSELVEEKYPKVRAVTRKDRRKLTKLLTVYIEKSGNTALAEMIPGLPDSVKKNAEKTLDKKSDEEGLDVYELIKSVLISMFEFFDNELALWFIEISDIKDIEEFDKMPCDVELNIIDQCVAQKGFKNLFTRALDLYKKIQG